jgi:YD repeat-containing protein
MRGQVLFLACPRDEADTLNPDPLHRLIRTIGDAGGINATTQFAYDARDNLTAVTDPTWSAAHFPVAALHVGAPERRSARCARTPAFYEPEVVKVAGSGSWLFSW